LSSTSSSGKAFVRRLGTAGGIGLVAGSIGLLLAKIARDPMLMDQPRLGMDVAFIAMLLATSVTGLALLLLRQTPAMGIALAIHYGVVFSLFLTMPYGKLVQGFYRLVALARYAGEMKLHG